MDGGGGGGADSSSLRILLFPPPSLNSTHGLIEKTLLSCQGGKQLLECLGFEYQRKSSPFHHFFFTLTRTRSLGAHAKSWSMPASKSRTT